MKHVKDIADLQEWLVGLFNGRPGDKYPRYQHAGNVSATAFAICGAIMWRADRGSIRIRECKGRTTNMAWFTVGGKEYVVGYSGKIAGITLYNRAGSSSIASFNASTLDTLHPVFSTL